MKKLFISLLAVASLAAPSLANRNPELAQGGGLTGVNVSSKTSDPEVKFYTPDATGCMILRECTDCLLYTSPSPRDATLSRMPSSA